MRTVSYLRWSPSASSLCIEFPRALLGEIRGDCSRDGKGSGSGVLFGVQHGSELRLLAWKPYGGENPSLASLFAAGIYFCRPRGEVFLTEEDLEAFQASQAKVALVISGTRAGFFLRESDGSIDSLTSPEEFAVPVAKARTKATLAANSGQAGADWALRLMVAAVLVAIPLAGRSVIQPFLPEAPKLSLQDEAGQLKISWNPRATRWGANLEIAEGERTILSHLERGENSATYVPMSRMVKVTIRSEGPLGTPVTESAIQQMGTPVVEPPPVIVQALEQEVASLEQELHSRQERLNLLELTIVRLRNQLR